MSPAIHKPGHKEPAIDRPGTDTERRNPEARTFTADLDLVDEPELPDLFPPRPASQPDPDSRGRR
jgi:hypothetical protein